MREPPPDDREGVVWLDGNDVAGESELLPGPERPPLGRRTRIVLGAVTAVLVGLGVAAVMVNDHGRPSAAPAVPSPDLSATHFDPPVDDYPWPDRVYDPDHPPAYIPRPRIEITIHDGSPSRVIRLPTVPDRTPGATAGSACTTIEASGTTCRESDAIPVDTARALTAAVPSAHATRVDSVYDHAGQLFSRRIHATAPHGENLTIEISPPTGAPVDGSYDHTATTETVSVQLDAGNHRVSVTAVAPIRHSTPLPKLTLLARDVRLFTID